MDSHDPSPTPVRALVEKTILEVAADNHKRLPPLNDDLALLNSGLDSLCLAVIVARLEDGLGVDPFSAAGDMVFPVTVGEFIALYEHAVR
jgi:acyl carrier protein